MRDGGADLDGDVSYGWRSDGHAKGRVAVMDDMERKLIECATMQQCSNCEAYPTCGGMLDLLLTAAKEIGRLKEELAKCRSQK